MGTRCLTVINDDDLMEEICVIYRQHDGYPRGHGLELYNFLDKFYIVNGIGLNDERKIANGMSCLAAQLIAHFKEGAGSIYIHQAGTRDIGEAYIYVITYDSEKDKIVVEVDDVGSNTPTFKGGLELYHQWIHKMS